jgi:hypothetical protein
MWSHSQTTTGDHKMCQQSQVKTYAIPSWNVDVLKANIAKLNKRADKLGCDHIKLVAHGVRSIVDPVYQMKMQEGRVFNVENPPMIKIHDVELVGAGPKLNGWKFIGTLDHHTVPGSVIVKGVPGEHIPSEFYHNDATCNHCNTIRYRTETFILENVETGEFKQVGRQCIKDFLGHNPSRIASLLTQIYKMIDELGDPDSDYYGGGAPVYVYDKLDVLMWSFAIIKTFGWVSRSAAEYSNKQATADNVAWLMLPPANDKERQAQKDFVADINRNDEEDLADAKAAIAWVLEQDETNDYIHNLQALAAGADISIKMFGYWCSLASTYMRAMDKLREAEKQNKTNAYVGEIKKRQDFDVEVVSVNTCDGYYGITFIYKFLDKDGHTLVWFASNEADMRIGGKYNVKATVKKHDEYKGWKQTIVNRVKINKVLEDIK